MFNSLWNLKTLILQQHLERGSKNMCGLRVKNVCLLEHKKKKMLNYEVASFCEKVEKDVSYRHPKVVGPKPTWWQFGIFRVPFGTLKVLNWLLEAKRAFMFRCHLISPSKVFWPVLVPRRIFNLCLWFFGLFSR